MMKKLIAFTAITLFFAACKNENSNEDVDTTPINAIAPPTNISYNIVASYPHDTSSYTQGLIWQDNALYEGTGLEGQSKLLKVDLKNGKAEQQISLDPSIFGEGVTIFNEKIYQLTYQNNKVYIYDRKTFNKIKELSWPHEGWGLTHNGKELIVSTGDSNLYFVDPETFNVIRIVGVSDNNGPLGNLNELEYIDGYVYANIYLTEYIIKINPENGHIEGKMDFTGLLEKSGKTVNKDEGFVLNGIAYDSTKKSVYITGKKWPLLFEMKMN